MSNEDPKQPEQQMKFSDMIRHIIPSYLTFDQQRIWAIIHGGALFDQDRGHRIRQGMA